MPDFWVSENPKLAVADPLHPERITVGVRYRTLEYSVPRSQMIQCDVYFSLLNNEFILFMTGYGIQINSARFQQDGARPKKPTNPYFFLHKFFEETILSNRYSVLFEKDFFSWPPTSPDLTLAIIFCGGSLKDRAFQKIQYTIPEPKTAIQSVIEAISTVTLTKILNNSVLLLHKCCDLRECHMEHVQGQQISQLFCTT
jgi:hypothetical protein